ncbi:hypothetical protein [Tateyamaria sp.]|uniref:hypothetical protein n=1 Tax=Tateyamaria sp. TaxID=1929288 RepID=UPI003B2281CA
MPESKVQESAKQAREIIDRLDFEPKPDPRKEWVWLDSFPKNPKQTSVPQGYAFNLLGDTRRHLLKALGFSGACLDCMQDILETMTRSALRTSGPLAGYFTRTVDRDAFMLVHGHSESTFKRTLLQAKATGVLDYRNVSTGKGKGSRTHFWLTDQAHKFFHVWGMATDDLPANVRRSGRLFETLQRTILTEPAYIKDMLHDFQHMDVATCWRWVVHLLRDCGTSYRAGETVADIFFWIGEGQIEPP